MKPRIREVIVVEGRYDKNAVSQVVDAQIIETNGFGIFSDREKSALLRTLAEKRGLVILTDSDGAGFLIRNHLKGIIGAANIKQAYIPEISGKERRKTKASKEGTLGVEGMRPEIILNALKGCGASFENADEIPRGGITKADLYALGLSGSPESVRARAELLKRLSLPSKLTSNALLDVLNALYTKDELIAVLEYPR